MHNLLSTPSINALIIYHLINGKKRRTANLLPLCLVSKSICAIVARALYSTPVLESMRDFDLFMHAKRHFDLVDTLVLYTPVTGAQGRALLVQLPNLTVLYLNSLSPLQSDGDLKLFSRPEEFPFQLVQLYLLRMPWDALVAAFVKTQRRSLKKLQISTSFPFLDPVSSSASTTPAEAIDLPDLRHFTGLASILPMLNAPLAFVDLNIEMNPMKCASLKVLPPTVKHLSLARVPDDPELGEYILEILASRCKNVKSIAGIPLPPQDRSKIHQALLKLPQLRSMELHITRAWNPTPGHQWLRILASELRTYRPTLTQVSVRSRSVFVR
ncbi:hypothetical protein CPB85DRAFT_1323747 [Mucidula mucida]|nr:hypothetical protein CPB85DRAFT_1323747 [Mucidula mucida]